MDDVGAGSARPSGQDGTQAPPPPRVFPDPLAGLVTGERPYRPGPVAPVVQPVVVPLLASPRPPSAPSAPHVPPARRPARAQRPVTHHPRQAGPPTAHLPHPGLARRPAPAPVPPEQKKGRGGLIGCLVLLAALSGLLFNVVREIVQAVADLLR